MNNSDTMISGVTIKILQVHSDVPDSAEGAGEKPGCLMEVLRADENLLRQFGQTVFTVSYPGTIKAFHWHKKQDDLWFIASGRAKIVLYDQRPESPTYKVTQVIYAGTNDYKLVVIPVGVVHGYKVVGREPVLVFYHVTEPYNAQAPDELRIPYNDPTINFDWSAD